MVTFVIMTHLVTKRPQLPPVRLLGSELQFACMDYLSSLSLLLNSAWIHLVCRIGGKLLIHGKRTEKNIYFPTCCFRWIFLRSNKCFWKHTKWLTILECCTCICSDLTLCSCHVPRCYFKTPVTFSLLHQKCFMWQWSVPWKLSWVPSDLRVKVRGSKVEPLQSGSLPSVCGIYF